MAGVASLMETAIIACRAAECRSSAMPECGQSPDPVTYMPPTADSTPGSTTDSSPPRRGRSILGLAPRAWLCIAIAIAIGIGLFLLIWSRQRDADDFYRPDTSHTGASGAEFEPLPQPASGDTGLDQPRPAPGGDAEDEPDARIVETAPAPMAPPPTAVQPAAAPPPANADSAPVATSTPQPRYPVASLRRHESGTVLLRVVVGPDGVPAEVNLVDGSGHRRLDRAATDAVRKWRFRPAMRGGRPVSGEVRVPIVFEPAR